MVELFRPRMALAGMRTTRELYVGEGSSVVLRSLDAARALVVMSRSVAAGDYGRLLVERVRAGEVRVVSPSWDGEPSVDGVLGLVTEIEVFKPDVVVAVGGGSVIDGVKVARLLANQPDTELSLPAGQVSLVVRPQVPQARLVAVPTTAGTGSEISSVAIVVSGGRKVPVVSSALMPDAAVLDPLFLVGAPRRVAYSSFLDAFSHVVEGYVSSIKNPLMDSFAESAARDLHFFAAAALNDSRIDALERVQIASLMAGWVQNQSLVGACHAVAHCISNRHGHGEANAIVLPHVIRLNAERCPQTALRYGLLARVTEVGDDASALADWVEQVRADAQLPDASVIDNPDLLVTQIVADAAARTNPVPVDEGFARELVASLVAVSHVS